MIVSFLTNVAALIVTLGILVTIHEFGHFWVARRCGVKVLRFSIGFGKAAKTWIGKDGVEYVIAPIPLGGYVKMLGQEDTTVTDPGSVASADREMSFACKPLWQRMAIVAAGPLANFILAIVVFWFINITYGINGIAPVISNVLQDSAADQAGLRAGDEIVAVDGVETILWQQVSMQLLGRMGETGDLALSVKSAGNSAPREVNIPIRSWLGGQLEPNPVADLGIVQFEIPALIAGIIDDSPAQTAGLQAGDLVISAAGEDLRGWTHWVEVIRASPQQTLAVTVQRAGSIVQLELTPELTELDDGQQVGRIGASVQDGTLAELLPPEMLRQIKYGVFSGIVPALNETWDKSLFILDSMKKMLIGLISVKNISGPITIATVAGDTASYGLEVYLGFLAILSISLGVLNLLPIPVLDGGHLMYYLIEAVIRRPVPERIQNWGLQLGLILISGIMMLAVYNDVNRLL